MGKDKIYYTEHSKLIYQKYLTGTKSFCFNLGYKLRTYYKIFNAEGDVSEQIFKKSVVSAKLFECDSIKTYQKCYSFFNNQFTIVLKTGIQKLITHRN